MFDLTVQRYKIHSRYPNTNDEYYRFLTFIYTIIKNGEASNGNVPHRILVNKTNHIGSASLYQLILLH